MRKTLIFWIIVLCVLAQIQAGGDPLVIPRPQKMCLHGGILEVASIPLIEEYYDDEPFLGIAAQELSDIFGRLQKESKNNTVSVVMIDLSSQAWQQSDMKRPDVNAPTHSESYVLDISEEKILIMGADASGLFYGFQTLKQLLEHENTQIVFPLLTIEDHPELSFRGIHFFTGRQALKEQKQLIDFMAMHKMNYAVMQLDYMKFENFPEMFYEPFGQCQDEVRELVTYARERNITMIPLVPSYGHAEWAFRTGHFKDIAEQSVNPRTFRVNYPRTYEVLFKIYDEVMDIFEPEWFHIGFDEVDHPDLAIYPYREETKKYSLEELIEMHLDKIADYLAENDIDNILMWGDMFLSREDAPTTSPAAASAPSPEIAQDRRDILVKMDQKEDRPGIIISDWHYQPNEIDKFTSLQVWHEDGFQTIASTWHNPNNIRNFTLRAIQENSLGMLQTTWAGFNFFIVENERNHHQFTAYLLAADYSWSGREELAPDLPYDYTRTFWKRWDAQLRQPDGTISPENLSAAEQSRLFERGLDSKVQAVIPDDLSQEITKIDYTWKYSFYNPFDRKVTITVGNNILSDKRVYSVAPLKNISGEEIVFSRPFEKVRPTDPMEMNFTVAFDDQDQIVLSREEFLPLIWVARKLEESPRINADLSCWENIPSYELADEGFISQKDDWDRDDLSANMFIGHYDEKLYFAFRVRDDTHHNTFEAHSLWQGDGIQMAIDFMFDRTPYYNENDIEMGVALHNDGNIMRYSWFPRDDSQQGLMKKTEAAINRNEPYTYYEIMIPIDIMSLPEVKGRDKFGFTFSINDNDGRGFDGGIIGSQGIWGTKDPSLFGILVLE